MPVVKWEGDRLAKAAMQAALEVCSMTAEIVKGEAVNLCPLDTSQTRNSATVTELERGAKISFNTPQAVWLHESENYTPSHAGTGPNYLRQPLLDNEEKFHADVAAAIKAIFG
jgi:hypothetical protein